MCLTLHNGSFISTKKFRAKKKPIRAYKVLMRSDPALLSPYQCVRWELDKIMISNRDQPNPTQMTSTEKKLKKVNRGLHFFRTIAAAKAECRWTPDGEIWTVEIQPEDIVAVGFFLKDKSIVTHKAKLIRKVS